MTSTTVRRKKRKDEIKVAIGSFRNQADYNACEDIQQEVFRHSDIDIIPIHILVAASRAGGILLGAYSSLGELIGFTFSILGTREGKPIQHCCMMAVRAVYRNFDIGYKLQTALREEALNRKSFCVTCAFDPMQPLHAYFFLGKLGFQAESYEENLYGDATSRNGRGLPSDRMTAIWDLHDGEVAKRLETGPLRHDFRKELKCVTAINQLLEAAPGLFISSPIKKDYRNETLLFEVPYNIPEIKNRDIDAAIEWQMNLRQVFGGYFKNGYMAADFWLTDHYGRPRTGYMLEKRKRQT